MPKICRCPDPCNRTGSTRSCFLETKTQGSHHSSIIVLTDSCSKRVMAALQTRSPSCYRVSCVRRSLYSRLAVILLKLQIWCWKAVRKRLSRFFLGCASLRRRSLLILATSAVSLRFRRRWRHARFSSSTHPDSPTRATTNCRGSSQPGWTGFCFSWTRVIVKWASKHATYSSS